MSDKYQKEIEEILRRADEARPDDKAGAPGKQAGAPRGTSNPLGRIPTRPGFKISAGKVMLTSFAFLIIALVLGTAGVASQGFLVVLVLGLILFVVGYALFFVRPTPSYEKRWRGRLIEERTTLWDRFKRWTRG